MNTLNDYLKDGWIKFLRTGIFQDSKGRIHHFDREKLQTIESRFNAAAEKTDFEGRPICFGHPKSNEPKEGLINAVKQVGDFLLAKPKQIYQRLKDSLKDGLVKYVSPKFSKDYDLQHLGLVDDPAIKGLGPFSADAFSFSESDEEDEILLSFEFAELDEYAVERLFKNIGNVFQRLREYLIERDGREKADKAVNYHIIEFITDYPVLKREDSNFENNNKSGEEPGKEDKLKDTKTPGKETVQEPPEPSIDFSAKYEAEKDRAEKAEKKASELEAKIAEDAKKQREEKVIEFCANQVKEGRLYPKEKPGMEKFLMRLDTQESIEFSEGSEKQTDVQFMKSFLEGLQKRVPLDPLPKTGDVPKDDIEFSADKVDSEDLELDRRARAIMASKNCSYEDALREAQGGN